MGGALQRDPTNDDARDIRAIHAALELGISHFDTAELYADGYSEKLLAQALEGIPRNSLFLASKVKPANLKCTDVIAAAKRSLERLNTDYLDLYYIHAVNPDIPLDETMAGLNQLRREGLVRAIAVSNFATTTLRRAQQLCESPIVANQVHYNLKFRGPETKGLLPYCQKENIALIAWRPVQYGELASSAHAGLIHQLAQKYEKTPAQIAINWLITQVGVGTLFMSRNEEHIKENLGALGWHLEPADVEMLRREFPAQEEDSDRMPLS